MSIKIIRKDEQANGQFNNGEILEKKPIGFPQDGGKQRPYSNLFYWAHAWSDKGSVIGEHPHRGFEIMSFVLRGTIDHYDSHYKEWKRLNKGDVQIIRAGNGITHAERLNPGSAIFQIWVDPNLNETLDKPASYSDYKADSFPVTSENGTKVTVYRGPDSPLEMDTPSITIKKYELEKGEHNINLKEDAIFSTYLVKGSLSVDDEQVNAWDYFIVKDQDEMKIEAVEPSTLFTIESPVQPPYPTYAERFM